MDASVVHLLINGIFALAASIIGAIATLLAARRMSSTGKPAHPQEMPLRLRKGRIFALAALFFMLFTSSGFYISNRFFAKKDSLILFGSGSTFSFLYKNCSFLFPNKNFEVVQMDAPTNSALATMAYTYTREENKGVKFPAIIGLAGEEINDSLFVAPDQKDVQSTVKFYAIKITKDTLLASFGTSNPKMLQALGYQKKNPVISLETLAKLINEADVVFIPMVQSGTYRTWFNYFKEHHLVWPSSKKIRQVEKSKSAGDDISDMRTAWVSLASKNYPLTDKVANLDGEVMVKEEDGLLTRPVYLYGVLPGKAEPYKGGYVYKLEDEVVCRFWRCYLDSMSKREVYRPKIAAIRKDFLVDIGDGKLAVVAKSGRQNVMIFRDN